MGRKLEEKLHRLVEEIRSGEFDYQGREETKRDWAAYDKAQINQLVDVVELIKKMVDKAASSLQHERNDPGRPPKPAADKVKILLWQQYLGISNRVSEGWLHLIGPKLGISEDFSYKTIERAYDDDDVKFILQEIFEMTSEPAESIDRDFAIDSTGDSSSFIDNYNEKKHNDGKTRGSYQNRVCMIGCQTKLFVAARCGLGNSHENPYFKPLMKDIQNRFERIDSVSADSGFLSRENCDLVAAAGGVPRIMPKTNSRLKKKGSKAWKDMLLGLAINAQDWLREFHLRSLIESSFSSQARTQPKLLTRKLDPRKKTEQDVRLVLYNIKRLPFLCYKNLLEFSSLPGY